MVNVRKYVGKTAREALAQVKTELGADAIVLSNRSLGDQVEIVAIPAEQMGELSATVRQARAPAAPPAVAAAMSAATANPAAQHAAAVSEHDGDYTLTLGQHLARAAREQASREGAQGGLRSTRNQPAARPAQAAAPAQVVRPFNPPRVNSYGEPLETAPAAIRQPARPVERMVEQHLQAHDPAAEAKVQALEATNARLMDELASIKGLLERQLAGFAWSEITRQAPARTQLMSELLEVGFSSQLTRSLTEQLRPEASLDEARKHVRDALARNLRTLSTDTDIIDRGGVYALVGPTGVGKTTTTAKLAARCVVRHGADKLALITTDGYRIGAHEQLRIYGRILGVQVYVVRDASDLRQTLQELRGKHMVLIDTVGMSQRDRMVVEQASMLTSAGNIKRLLVLNATAQGSTLDDVMRAYEGQDLAGCVLSKVDEAASLAPALDVAMRHELSVFYIANGQRVPEDLHLPNRAYLIHRALREIAQDSPYKLDQSDAGLLMAGSTRQGRGAAAGGAL